MGFMATTVHIERADSSPYRIPESGRLLLSGFGKTGLLDFLQRPPAWHRRPRAGAHFLRFFLPQAHALSASGPSEPQEA